MKEGFEPVTVDTLGGLCTLMERSDLPLGVAAVATNVEFFPGGFRTRDGFKPYLSESGAGNFTAIYDHVDGRGVRHHMTYQDGVGRIGSRVTGTTIDTVLTKMGGAVNTYQTMKATSLYGRIYACISDGRRGLSPPIQWDGVLDPANIAATGGHDATITAGAGTGGMVGGRYYVVVAYETVSGYITGTTKLNYLTVSNNAKLLITAIPLGPVGTVKRRIFVSLVDSFDLYNPPALVINDNTTTTIDIDLTQEEIADGLPFIDLVALQIPTAHVGVENYSNRLVMWGGDGKINAFYGPLTTAINSSYSSIGLINLDFSDRNAASYNWAVPGIYGEWYNGNSFASMIAGSKTEGELSNYLRLTAVGGVSTTKVQQGYGSTDTKLNKDALGNYYLSPGRRYGIRARARVSHTTAQAGSISIALYETASLASRTKIAEITSDIDALDAIDGWRIIEGDGTVTTTGSAYVSIDISFINGDAGDTVDFSHIEIYDLDAKRGNSKVNVSRVFDPESFDALQGVIQVSPNDGQEIRNIFVLRGNMYICKERSLYVTQDNQQEPAFWNVELVSSTVGTSSVHGVGLGDGWAVIVSRDGLYMFDGGAPNKISQEIQPTWDLFDWTKGEQIWCAVNTAKQTIVVNGPTKGGGRQQLRLSYVSGFGNPLESNGGGRAWSVDVPYGAGGFAYGAGTIILDNGDKTISYAGNIDNTTPPQKSLISYESNGYYLDFGYGQIYAYYETAPIGGDMGRSLFGALAAKVRGLDTVVATIQRPNGVGTFFGSKTLSANPLHDVEWRLNITDTQIGVRLSNNPSLISFPTGGYFIVKRIALWAKKSPSASIRGY